MHRTRTTARRSFLNGALASEAAAASGAVTAEAAAAAPGGVPPFIKGKDESAFIVHEPVEPEAELKPADRLRVQLVNRLSTPTNLHVHGLQVSPDRNGDNPFIRVDPGDSFGYDYQLPEDHPPGVCWYHPHHHGTVADQIFGGLYGAIIVSDPDEPAVTRERVLVISDISLDRDGRVQPVSTMARMMGREGDLVLVNGQAAPVLTARPGQREALLRWASGRHG